MTETKALAFPMDKKLTCHRCGHVWIYRGANPYYCSCPHCKTTVPIRPPLPKKEKAVFNYTCVYCSTPYTTEKELKRFLCSKCNKVTDFRPKRIRPIDDVIYIPPSTPQPIPEGNLTVIQLPAPVTPVKSNQDLPNIKTESKDTIVKKDEFEVCKTCKISYPGCMRKCKLLSKEVSK